MINESENARKSSVAWICWLSNIFRHLISAILKIWISQGQNRASYLQKINLTSKNTNKINIRSHKKYKNGEKKFLDLTFNNQTIRSKL